MKYNTVYPYFPEVDIAGILDKYRDILAGQGMMTMGEQVRQFETTFASYIGSKYAVATSSCTSALEIALKVLGVKAGDEVIVPTQTFIATGSCVVAVGAVPVFCECDHNFLLDVECLLEKITDRTRAVILVHFTGLIHPRIAEIKAFLKEKKIYLIEDAAHAHGAKINDTLAGNIGDIGCFSFYATKIMSTGEGGMLTVNDGQWSKTCSSLRNRGLDTDAGREVFTNLGSNCRMTEFQAILGNYQLNRLEEFVWHRNQIAATYKSLLAPLEEKDIIRFQEYPNSIRHAYWRFLVFLKDTPVSRDQLKEKMARAGIAIDFPYSPLLHLQPVFRKMFNINEGWLAKTEGLAATHFCLPMHLKISVDDVRFIANTLKEVLL